MDANIDINAYVTNKFGVAIGWKNEWESFWGDGNGRFLGLFNSPATINLSRNTSSTWKYADFVGMLKRMWSLEGAEWARCTPTRWTPSCRSRTRAGGTSSSPTSCPTASLSSA